ncbi:MAG: nucleotidyltransferase family protein [Nitrosomonadales bacterium]|nr:nucleotidyltransferase family protein [Nitrosomonadales bacterium]
MNVVGILLAAGHSRRFGAKNKLIQSLADGAMMALSSAGHLMTALPHSVAIVRPDSVLQAKLADLGLMVTCCQQDEQDMAASLVAAVRYGQSIYPETSGYVIALADMPYIHSQTIYEVAKRIDSGGPGIVVPRYQGRRGHPVGFSARFTEELLVLTGDQGAKVLLEKYPSELDFFECEDPGILVDIDTPVELGLKPS